MKIYLFSILIIIQINIGTYSVASVPLTPTCYSVPNNSEIKLCTLVTESTYGPYDDVVFYRYSKLEGYKFLSQDTHNGSTFGSVVFSPEGKYAYLSFAEEGHPIIYFYKTATLLENGHRTSLNMLSEYYLEYIEAITDEGKVYYYYNGDQKKCVKPPIGIRTGDNDCLVLFSIE